ncbi:hypothetical protein ABH908_000029 [Pseudomonas frederiksbergensis]|uniref:hypothetical protein n=1 Tax=Pseudomonas TaxID=286 RepID=UPI003D1AA26A
MLSKTDHEKLAQAKAAADALTKALQLLVSSDDPLLSVLAEQELQAAVKIDGAIGYWHAVTGESEA